MHDTPWTNLEMILSKDRVTEDWILDGFIYMKCPPNTQIYQGQISGCEVGWVEWGRLHVVV